MLKDRVVLVASQSLSVIRWPLLQRSDIWVPGRSNRSRRRRSPCLVHPSGRAVRSVADVTTAVLVLRGWREALRSRVLRWRVTGWRRRVQVRSSASRWWRIVVKRWREMGWRRLTEIGRRVQRWILVNRWCVTDGKLRMVWWWMAVRVLRWRRICGRLGWRWLMVLILVWRVVAWIRIVLNLNRY